MAAIRLDDTRLDAAGLKDWLLRAGFSPGPDVEDGRARWVKYPADGREGLPAEAVEVRLGRAAGGHLELQFFDPEGEPVEVEPHAFEPRGPMTAFVDRHYRHYNAGVVARAARGWRDHLAAGKRMMVTLAGAMSTAELGISLAELIRNDKVHAITCTGANLEEDLFLLFAREAYRHVDWRALSAEAEQALYASGMNRVTDVCIPDTVVDELGDVLREQWSAGVASGRAPTGPVTWLAEALAVLLARRTHYRARRRDSWVCAALDKGIPIYVPGWADSTLGNGFAAWCIEHGVRPESLMSSDVSQMIDLVAWYRRPENQGCGFFQIGGGIAGDFPICAVPLITRDLEAHTALWGYYCQIGDAPASYGGYSGAPPNEKITWGKLSPGTPKFMIQSDATIVAPLIFAYVMGW